MVLKSFNGCPILMLGMSGLSCSMTASRAVCMAVAAVSGVSGVVVVQDFRSSSMRDVTLAHRLALPLLLRRASVVYGIKNNSE